MSTVLGNLGRVIAGWRDRLVGPTLRTYDEACEELGGVPWRAAHDDTERWFIGRADTLAQRLPSFDRIPLLDTGAFVLKRAMSDGTKLLFAGAAALLAIALVVIALAGGARAATEPSSAASSPSTATASPTANASPAANASPTAGTAPAAAAHAATTTASAPIVIAPEVVSRPAHAAAKKHPVAARHHRR
jgi:hypothetical protein